MIKFTELRCSFCGKKESEVSKLVAGPRLYICDQCVAVASQIMGNSSNEGEPRKAKLTIWQKLSDRGRRLLHWSWNDSRNPNEIAS
jgi:ATP-dependent Clp protease ATP-binding subunit ClpX